MWRGSRLDARSKAVASCLPMSPPPTTPTDRCALEAQPFAAFTFFLCEHVHTCSKSCIYVRINSRLISTTLLDSSYLNKLRSLYANTACAHPLTVKPADRLRRNTNSFSSSLRPASNPIEVKFTVKSNILVIADV